MGAQSERIKGLFAEELAKVQAYLESHKKTHGDSLGGLVSEVDLTQQVT